MHINSVSRLTKCLHDVIISMHPLRSFSFKNYKYVYVYLIWPDPDFCRYLKILNFGFKDLFSLYRTLPRGFRTIAFALPFDSSVSVCGFYHNTAISEPRSSVISGPVKRARAQFSCSLLNKARITAGDDFQPPRRQQRAARTSVFSGSLDACKCLTQLRRRPD